MSSMKPIKTLPITGITLTPLSFWPTDEGTYYGEDQWWAGGPAPQPVTWTLQGTIIQQNHSSFSTPQIYIYNALDIRVGDWYIEASTSKALRITGIDGGATNEGYISCTIEDVDRYEQFSAPDGVTATGTDGFIVSLDQDGLPIFHTLTVYSSIVSANPGFIEDVISRFKYRNLNTEYVRVNQPGHSFQIGDNLVLNSNGTFSLADSSIIDGERIIGAVTDISIPGTDWFDYDPRGQLQSNLSAPLPGPVGGIVWLDPANPGKLTDSKPNSLAIPLYIKIDDTTGVRLSDGPVGPYDNFDSTRDPTSTDDESLGYQVGSQWVNGLSRTAWVLVDPAIGAAIWKQIAEGPTGPTGAPQAGAYQKYEFVAQQGQYVFYADHVPGYTDVYYDGVRLTPDQYDDSNASYVLLNNPAIGGDPVEIIAWQIASISQLTGPSGPTGPAATGAYVRHEFTATDGQTVFSVPYSVGFIDVYYDGTLLQTDQYTATDGNTVVLDSPAIGGDPVVMISWEIAHVSQLTGPSGPTGPAATGAYVRYDFVATDGQTIYRAPYHVGFVDVYYDGTLLSADQYTATDGNTVILNNPSIGGDQVIIFSWEIANVSQLTGPTGPAATGAFQRTEFVAANGQRVFNVSYYPGYLDVYYDGTLLTTDRYTATDGSTVTLANAALGGDRVVMVAWELTNVSQLTGPTGSQGPTGAVGPTGVAETVFFGTIADRDASSPYLGELAYVSDDGTGNASLYIAAQITPSVIWLPVSMSQGNRRFLSTLTGSVSYSDSNPVVLGILEGGTTVLNVDVLVITPFNDPSAAMTIGTDAQDDAFMGAGMLDPTTAGTYINESQQQVLSLTVLKAFFTPGFSGTGSVQIVITYQ